MTQTKPNSVRIAHASSYGQRPTSHLYNKVAHIFQKSRRNLKIVGVRRATLKQVTRRGTPHISYHSTNFSRHGNSASGICAPLLYKESAIVTTPNHLYYIILLNPFARGLCYVIIHWFFAFTRWIRAMRQWMNYEVRGIVLPHCASEPALRRLPCYLTEH